MRLPRCSARLPAAEVPAHASPDVSSCSRLAFAVPAIAETQAPTSRETIRLTFAPIVKKAAPAVVNVYSRRVVRARSPLFDDPFFRRFFGEDSPFGLNRERVQNSLGSGVILDPDGLIVTNHHVIVDADEIRVVLSDRREFEAKVVLSDEHSDLAVLKIDLHGGHLPALPIGDSDELEVGDLVLAIGNPFGVGQTVTSGIVSALARSIGAADFRSFIQTDAAINPGNSGGALVDLDGKLVGINTAIFSRSGGSMGIGFAIPSAMVRVVLEAARHGGKFVRPWLGASGEAVTADIAEALKLQHPMGVLVKDGGARQPGGDGWAQARRRDPRARRARDRRSRRAEVPHRDLALGPCRAPHLLARRPEPRPRPSRWARSPTRRRGT